jgi:hypothetical protein
MHFTKDGKESVVLKQITNVRDLQKKVEAVERAIVKPPYPGLFNIDYAGNFYTNSDVCLVPDEALRIGLFLVDFYGAETAE